MLKILITLLISIVFIFTGCHKAVIKVQPIDDNVQKSQAVIQEEKNSHVLKRKVAIARFSNETTYGKGIFYDGENDPLAKQAMDILSAKLGSTDKFILLERSDLDLIKNEKELGNIKNLDISADYLIIGSISEFGRSSTSDVGIFSRTKKQTARAKVYIRLVDVSTGQIIYSEEGEGEANSEAGTVLGVGNRAGYDSALNDKAISAAISKLVSNLVSNLLEKPWKSYILNNDNSNIIISGGKSQGINIGDTFLVIEKGDSVLNPQTNMMIELPGKSIAKIKVVSLAGDTIQNEISVCTLVEGNIIEDYSKMYIQEIR
ncbi:MAG: hypothetical protein JXR46_12155 [Calditrichaceae bacterium]|nr:hypothetical protein [Calditrichaceae bacterium]MBN2709789.1 hypothetical protein [Calditrichaceae bacterium]RQV94983.1 MAG: curli production assembly protein CsgG [Calditrichota bacterium]